MRHLSVGGRSRTVLLVVVGVLLVPTVALGARLVSSWQSGSPVVRRVGPLPSLAWSVPATDLSIFQRIEPLPLPPLNLSGAYVVDVAITTSVTIPQSLVDGLGDVLADNAGYGPSCYLIGAWGVVGGADDPYDFFLGAYGLFYFTIDDETDLDTLAGTHTFTTAQPTNQFRLTDLGSHLDDMTVGVKIVCESAGGVQESLGTPQLQFNIVSMRLLAV